MAERKKVGELLIEAKVISASQLQSALAHQKQWGGRLGTALIEKGFLSEDVMAKFLSFQLNYPSVSLSKIQVNSDVLARLPRELQEKYLCVPIAVMKEGRGEAMILAIADPTDLRAIDEIGFATGLKVKPVIATESSLKRFIFGDQLRGVKYRDPNDANAPEKSDEMDMEILQGSVGGTLSRVGESVVEFDSAPGDVPLEATEPGDTLGVDGAPLGRPAAMPAALGDSFAAVVRANASGDMLGIEPLDAEPEPPQPQLVVGSMEPLAEVEPLEEMPVSVLGDIDKFLCGVTPTEPPRLDGTEPDSSAPRAPANGSAPWDPPVEAMTSPPSPPPQFEQQSPLEDLEPEPDRFTPAEPQPPPQEAPAEAGQDLFGATEPSVIRTPENSVSVMMDAAWAESATPSEEPVPEISLPGPEFPPDMTGRPPADPLESPSRAFAVPADMLLAEQTVSDAVFLSRPAEPPAEANPETAADSANPAWAPPSDPAWATSAPPPPAPAQPDLEPDLEPTIPDQGPPPLPASRLNPPAFSSEEGMVPVAMNLDPSENERTVLGPGASEPTWDGEQSQPRLVMGHTATRESPPEDVRAPDRSPDRETAATTPSAPVPAAPPVAAKTPPPTAPPPAARPANPKGTRPLAKSATPSAPVAAESSLEVSEPSRALPGPGISEEQAQLNATITKKLKLLNAMAELLLEKGLITEEEIREKIAKKKQ